MKGIILAGGKGTRMYPASSSISKHLLPVNDKPMIYYSLVNLILTGINDILIITSERDSDQYKSLLGDGSKWGIGISYKEQKEALGIAHGILLAEEFIQNNKVCLHLGDNIFYGHDFVHTLSHGSKLQEGALLLAYPVRDPSNFGVVDFNEDFKALSIEEKPTQPRSNFAVTGLYFYDETVVERVKILNPSKRGELEITDLNNLYLRDNQLEVEVLGRGIAWLDAGTPSSLLETSNFIATIENRQGLRVGCPEESSWRMGFITDEEIRRIASECPSKDYADYLFSLLG